jgi:hypothetical protein
MCVCVCVALRMQLCVYAFTTSFYNQTQMHTHRERERERERERAHANRMTKAHRRGNRRVASAAVCERACGSVCVSVLLDRHVAMCVCLFFCVVRQARGKVWLRFRNIMIKYDNCNTI